MKRTLKEKLEMFRDRGWKYKDDVIYSPKGTAVKNHICSILLSKKSVRINISKGRLAWYLKTGELPTVVYHIDGNLNNTKWENLTDLSKRKRSSILKSTHTTVKGNQIYTIKEHTSSIELTYEIILSLGKGKLTRNAENLIINMVNQLSRKFNYYREEDKQDYISEGTLAVLIGWKTYNPDKYPNAFPYITEIIKRGFVKAYNTLQEKNIYSGYIPSKISINNWLNG